MLSPALGGGRPSVTGSRPTGAGTDLDRLFDDAMFRVLGARVRPDQPRDLRTAFDRVFVEKEIDGRSEVEYRGTSGTATLPIESGTVTSGPQAVIYRAPGLSWRWCGRHWPSSKPTTTTTRTCLKRYGTSSIASSSSLVGALGQEVRPAIARVDAAFALLIGAAGGWQGILSQATW